MYLKQAVTCLSFVLATVTIFNANILRVEASPAQRQEINAKANDWFYQGLIKVYEQDYQQAVSNFTKAIDINPQHAEAYYRRGLIYAQYASGKILNPDGTLPGCRKTNEYTTICQVEFTTKWKKENQRQAIADFDRAIQINRGYAAAYHQRGLLQDDPLNKLHDFQTAIILYNRYYSVNSNKLATNVLKTIDQKRGSSTESPNRKKKPEELIDEALELMNKRDYQTACQKLREAARVYKDRNKQREAEKVEQMIKEIGQCSNT